MSRDWKSLVEQMLQEAHDSGAFDNLPNAGQPLKLDDDPYTPSDMQLAHKILKDHNFSPEWVMLGKDVDALWERLLDNMGKGVRAYRGAVADAERSDHPADQRQRAETTWKRANEAWGRTAEKLNREILRYNLKVPTGIPQRPLFNVERELERLLGSVDI